MNIDLACPEVKGTIKRLQDMLQKGVEPWESHSRGNDGFLPRNAMTGLPYRGLSTWLLATIAWERDYTTSHWATREQWLSLGGKVQGDGIACQGEVLFNLAEVNHVEISAREPQYERAETIVKESKVKIRFGLHCEYHRKKFDKKFYDWILMPGVSFFTDGKPGYWSHLAHELIHWAQYGIERIHWRGSKEQGELIAEIGAAYLIDELAIPNLVASSPHVKKWFDEIDQDPNYFFDALRIALLSFDYLFPFGDSNDRSIQDRASQVSSLCHSRQEEGI